jgi:hypothetical protein
MENRPLAENIKHQWPAKGSREWVAHPEPFAIGFQVRLADRRSLAIVILDLFERLAVQ